MEPNYWLILSSLSLLAPAFVSYKTRIYDLSLLCVIVTVISSWYHYSKNPYILYIDYPLNQITHLTTVYRILPGGWASMPMYTLWLSYVVFIYYYGFVTHTLIWNPDLHAATPWHMTLHISTSVITSYTVYATYVVRTKSLINTIPSEGEASNRRFAAVDKHISYE